MRIPSSFVRARFAVVYAFVCTSTLFILVSSCASFSEKRVTIRSIPDSAEVYSSGGKVLGKTPLVLEGQKLDEATRGGRLDVLVHAPKYAERQITFDVLGEDTHEVRLRALDANYFSQRIMEDYGVAANELVRRLLTAQGLAFAGKLPEAEKELLLVEAQYPNLAALYVLKSDIERLRGNEEKARAYLLRARTVDPRDPVATRLLGTEGKK